MSLFIKRWCFVALTALLTAAGPSSNALAKCWPIAQGPERIMKASLPAAGTVRLTFLGHSSFLIDTPEGISAVTDFNGYIRPPEKPDIVTMNNAHDTHYTDYVDPEIGVVLRGWGPRGEVAKHDRDVGDLQVWNVPTNLIRYGEVETNGNSIFVFQVADICIAHLGHLHHVLTDENLAELGSIDVLLVPADGTYTMAQEYMVKVIDQIRPSVVIPMHYFSATTLERFVRTMGDRYEVVLSDVPTVTLSRLKMPYRKILVLPGI